MQPQLLQPRARRTVCAARSNVKCSNHSSRFSRERCRRPRRGCAGGVPAAAAAAAAAVPADVLDVERSHGTWRDGVHYCVMEVRDYELDQFQVVNNAIYASYLQHGRHKAFASLGLPVEHFQREGVLMALSELQLRYLAPLRAGDVFLVSTACAGLSAARLTVDHSVQQVTGHTGAGQAPQVVATGRATVVFLDGSYRPTRAPAAIRDAVGGLLAQYQQQQQQHPQQQQAQQQRQRPAP